MEGNLTKGPILKTLTKLAIPIMASSFLGTLYNITDMAWIGLLGSKAVAGVGVGGMFTWFSQGLAAMARMGGQVQVAQCIGRGEKEKAHGFAQAAVQLAAFMGMAYALLSLGVYETDGRIFPARRCGGTCSGHVLYKDCMWVDCVFLYDADADRTLYGAGRFENTVFGESDRTCDQYDPGSCIDSRTGTVSEAWCGWSSNCDSDSTGNCYEHYDSCNYRAEERKCTERDSAFG